MRTLSSLRRMSSRLACAAAIIALSVGSVTGLSSPASADKGITTKKIEIPMDAIPFAYLVADKAGKQVENPAIQDTTIDSKRYLIVKARTQQVFCAAWGSPIPTYSRSNQNISFGTQAVCDLPIPVKVKSVVYSGPDDNHLYTWQADTDWKFGVSSAWAGSHNSTCVAPISEYWRWQLLGYAQGDTNLDGAYERFFPYPGDGRSSLQCADMV